MNVTIVRTPQTASPSQRGSRASTTSRRGRPLLAALLGLAGVASACVPATQGPADGDDGADWSMLPQVVSQDPELAPLGSRQAKYDKLCSTPRGDSFFKAMCGGGRRPEIRNFEQLLKIVGLHENRAFALTGNSTSLVATQVTPLNPRMIVFPRVDETLQKPRELIALGFVRGEQFVEVVSRDSGTGDYNFYLFSFEQRCNYEGRGCDLASLLTEDMEHGWTAYSVYDQKELERTSFDCQSCHQPNGFGTKQMLRMQELDSPWLHWFPQRFVQRTESDRVLLAQFKDSHAADKQYGGIPTGVINSAVDEGSGAQLEALVRAEGFGEQPNPFDGSIAAEAASGAVSPTWQSRFDVALRGEAIAVPYPRVDVSDEAKRTAAAQSYKDVSSGKAPRQGLMDIRQIFSQDAEEKLGFVPKPGADGRTVLLQMCSRCHDGRSNPELTRSRFNVRKLDQMSRSEKDLAITRMKETGDLKMPPWRVGRLTSESLQAATAELQK